MEIRIRKFYEALVAEIDSEDKQDLDKKRRERFKEHMPHEECIK